MKVTAFLMSLLLVFSLAACTPQDKDGMNDNNNNSNLDGDSSDANGNNNNQNGANDDMPNKPDDSKENNENKPDGTPEFGEDYTGDRRFYYAGRLYQITDETVDPEDVGAELFSITDIVEDAPTAEGEGFGLDMDTNIYKFKEENEYNELIVKIGDRYYKATVRDDDLIPDPDTDTNSPDSDTGAGNTSNGSGNTGNTGNNGSGNTD